MSSTRRTIFSVSPTFSSNVCPFPNLKMGHAKRADLRELPEPVFPLPHAERVKLTREREIHVNNSFSALRARLRRLPPIHQTTFRAIIEHLGRVQSRSGQNKMDAKVGFSPLVVEWD